MVGFIIFSIPNLSSLLKLSYSNVLPNLKVENTKLCKFWIDIIAQFITLDNPMTLDLENLTFIEDCLNLENNIIFCEIVAIVF